MFTLLKNTISGFIADKCPQMSAALAYYALFSLPALLVIAITIAGFAANLASFAEDGGARRSITREVRQSLGDETAQQINDVIDRASKLPRSATGILASVGILVLGASGVMMQLQVALNEVWDVQPDPNRSTIKNFAIKRSLSFAMVAGAGFVLLLSMLVGATLATLGDQLARVFPSVFSVVWTPLISGGTDLVVATLLFAALFKWLPDVRVAWRDVWIGAGVTGLLFVVGKTLLATYFSRMDVGSTYGTAGSLALILIWVYYSSMIFLFGAELTHAIALSRDGKVEPEEGSVLVEQGDG